MEKGLHIKGEEIIFNKWSVGDIWINCITKSFRIKFEDIRLVAISPRLALDDEMLMVTLIDNNKQLLQFSHFEFGKKPIGIFEERLKLNSLSRVEWGKFSWEEHQVGLTDKVIYPEELYGEELFVQPKGFKRRLIQILKFLALRKSISGRFNPNIEQYLDQSSS